MNALRRMCLHLPFLATDRVRRRLDSAAGPLALTCETGGTLRLAAVDSQAIAAGLRPQLTLGQARAALPALQTCPHDAQADERCLQQLARWALRYGPTVQALPPDTLLVDVTGCQRLFGGDAALARAARQGLADQGFAANVAVADTLGAAYAIAWTGRDPVVVAPVGQAAAYLAPLPPAALRLPEMIVSRLAALGIRTIGDLLMLPRRELPARFGPVLVERLQQALGERAEPLEQISAEYQPQADTAFEHPTTDMPLLRSVITTLLERIFADLQRAGHALLAIDCILYHEGASPTVLQLALARASRAVRHVHQLLNERLEQLPRPQPVTALRVIVRQTSRWRGRQSALFTPEQADDPGARAALLDRLVTRLGRHAVLRPKLAADHQPERAARFQPLLPPTQDRSAHPTPAGALPGAPRPVRLLRAPEPIRVIARVPDGPPTWLHWHGREQVIAAADGPERIETGWWRGPDVRRDYFRVVTEGGEQLWLFHAFDDECWYVHGIFA
jgi:protein ImuB